MSTPRQRQFCPGDDPLVENGVAEPVKLRWPAAGLRGGLSRLLDQLLLLDQAAKVWLVDEPAGERLHGSLQLQKCEDRRHQLKDDRPVFDLGAQPRNAGRHDAAMIGDHGLAGHQRRRRRVPSASGLLDQACFVDQLIALKRELFVPKAVVEAECYRRPLPAFASRGRVAGAVCPFNQARSQNVQHDRRRAGAVVLPWKIFIPTLPAALGRARCLFLAGQCEIADGDDALLALGADAVPIGEGVELLNVPQRMTGLLLDPPPQTGLQRSVLKRKWSGGQGVRLPDGENTGFTVVYGDDKGDQVHFGFVGLDGGSVFPGSYCLIVHVRESGWPARGCLNRFKCKRACPHVNTAQLHGHFLALRTCTKMWQTRHPRLVTLGKEGPLSAVGDTKAITPPGIRSRKGGTPLVCLTAYTTPVARLVDPHCDVVLVGDSVGMVLHGLPSTLGVTLEMMIMHGKAVRRGLERPLMIVDMPFGSYEESPEQAFRNAARLMTETGCAAVKLEGGETMAETIRFLAARGVPVMAHVGLTPQAVNTFGGYRVQGRGGDAERIRRDALAVSEAGAFAVVLEKVPEALARRITGEVEIPTIGIGASAACDGQILVVDDMLGLFGEFRPKFVKRYGELGEAAAAAIAAYAWEVKERRFPGAEHVFADAPRPVHADATKSGDAA